MPRLSLYGGTPVRTSPFPSWPIFDEAEERAVLEVLRSGQWLHSIQGESSHLADTQDSPSKTAQFEVAFARAMGAGTRDRMREWNRRT